MQQVEEDAISEAIDAIRELSSYLERVCHRQDLGKETQIKSMSDDLSRLADKYDRSTAHTDLEVAWVV
ncbi:MAG: hypothetical protein AAF922_14975 [Pseudomonadota bacterium]